MGGSTFLQLFLLFDAFLIGVFVTMAIRHALAHFRPDKHDGERLHPSQTGHLPPAIREKLLEEAQANFQAVLNRTAKELEKDLESTADDIKKQVEKLGDEAEGKELDHYKATVVQLQDKTKDDMEAIDKELADQKAQLKAKFAEDLEAEKQRLLKQLDTKLSDAVGSFLLETLQHNVDLGAQTAYLVSMLEEHKAEFAKEIASEN